LSKFPSLEYFGEGEVRKYNDNAGAFLNKEIKYFVDKNSDSLY